MKRILLKTMLYIKIQAVLFSLPKFDDPVGRRILLLFIVMLIALLAIVVLAIINRRGK